MHIWKNAQMTRTNKRIKQGNTREKKKKNNNTTIYTTTAHATELTYQYSKFHNNKQMYITHANSFLVSTRLNVPMIN